MPITVPNDADMAALALTFLRNRFPNRDSGDGSFLDRVAKVFGMTAAGVMKAAVDADYDATPSTKTSSAALDGFAYLFGIPSNTAGVYGRKSASAASGGAGLCTGTNGTVYPSNAVLTAPDGATLLYLSGSVTIPGIPPGSSSIAGSFSATTLGTVGNLAIGTVLTWQSPPSGSDGTVTLTTALSGGTDTETDADLLTRILNRLQQPPKGGVAADYRAWAESQTGVERAYVYPLRGGTGTVHVVLTGPGTGTGRAPSAGTKTTVDAYINGSATTAALRPSPAAYTSYIPYMAATGLTIRLRMTAAATRYAFDWSSGTTSYTVAGYSTGSVTLNTTPPADLIAAALAGSKPRIQLIATSATSPLPIQVGVVSIAGNVLTLDTLPEGWVAPTIGDVVYAGGPMVSTIAQAVLDYVDSLGPSRASGYADTLDAQWEDTVAIARLSQVALDQVDSDDTTHFAKNVVSGGVTIGGVATDVVAADATSNPPELLWAAKIYVTD